MISQKQLYRHKRKMSFPSFFPFFESVVLKTIPAESSVLVFAESSNMSKSGDIQLSVNDTTRTLFTDDDLAIDGATVHFSGMFGNMLCRLEKNSWSIVEYNARR